MIGEYSSLRGLPARRATRSRGCSRGGSTSPTSTRPRRSRTSPAATLASRPGVPVFLRTVSGHRDTGFTDCPGNARSTAAAQPTRRRRRARSGCRSSTRRSSPGPCRAWSASARGCRRRCLDGRRLRRRRRSTVASTERARPDVDWTWDASLRRARPRTRRRSGSDERLDAGGRDDRRGRARRSRISGLAADPATRHAERRRGRGRDARSVHARRAPAVVTATVRDGLGEARSRRCRRAGSGRRAHAAALRPAALPDGIYDVELAAQAPAARRRPHRRRSPSARTLGA